MKLLLASILAVSVATSAQAAETVVVAAPRGVPAKNAAAFAEAIKKELGASVRVVKVPAIKAPKAGDRNKALAKLAAAKNATWAVDAAVLGKKLSVVAVNAQGDLSFDEADNWPKPAPKQKAELARAGKKVGAFIKSNASSAPAPVAAAPVATETAPAAAPSSSSDAFAEGSTPPWMANQPATTTPSTVEAAPAATAPTAMSTSPTENVKRETKSGRGSFRIGLGGLVGGAGYSENIDSSRPQGDRDVTVSFAPQFGGQLELEHAIGLRFNFQYLRQSASVRPDVTDATDIDLSSSFINGRLSYALTHGDYPIAVLVGVKRESTDASAQEGILWVPDSRLLSFLLGASVSYGDLATRGVTFEAIGALVPYGSHTRTADDLELSSRALGALAQARVRYQWPKAFGSSAGVFLEAAGNARYLTFSAGDVTLPTPSDTDQVAALRTNALPIGDEGSHKLDYGLTASIGIMWRPGD
jgi:hypothetical protein